MVNWFMFTVIAPSASDADAMVKALQEANMATEVGLIVLDILFLYCNTFKVLWWYSILFILSFHYHYAIYAGKVDTIWFWYHCKNVGK